MNQRSWMFPPNRPSPSGSTAVSWSKRVRAPLLDFPPHLDRDLLDGQRDGWLGLGRLDGDVLDLVVAEQAVRDGRAQALEGLVGALLGDEGDGLAHLAVVDGVLQAIGDRGVGLADVEAQVKQQALADLALGLG